MPKMIRNEVATMPRPTPINIALITAIDGVLSIQSVNSGNLLQSISPIGTLPSIIRMAVNRSRLASAVLARNAAILFELERTIISAKVSPCSNVILPLHRGILFNIDSLDDIARMPVN